MKKEIIGYYTKFDREYTEDPGIRGEQIAERFGSLPLPENGTIWYYTFSAVDPHKILIVIAEKIITKHDKRGSSQYIVYNVSDLPRGSAEIAAAILTNLCQQEQQVIRASDEEAAAALTLLSCLPSRLRAQIILTGDQKATGCMRFADNATQSQPDTACLHFAEQPERYAAGFEHLIYEASRYQTLTPHIIHKCLEKSVGVDAMTQPRPAVKTFTANHAATEWYAPENWNLNPLLANAVLLNYAGERIRIRRSEEIWNAASPAMIAQFAAEAVTKPELAQVLPLCSGRCAALDTSLRVLCTSPDDPKSRQIKGYMLAYLSPQRCSHFFRFWQNREERYKCALEAYLSLDRWRDRLEFRWKLRRNLLYRERAFLLLRLVGAEHLYRIFPKRRSRYDTETGFDPADRRHDPVYDQKEGQEADRSRNGRGYRTW